MVPLLDRIGPDEPVLVTVAEKERLGYFRPEDSRTPGLQRKVWEHREQIYSVVQPYVERELGREVRMTGISTGYPYSAANVRWRTVDEPIVASYEFVEIEADGTLRSEAHISRTGDGALAPIDVGAIYLMAYRTEVTALREHLATAYPHLAPLPKGYSEAFTRADRTFAFHYDDQRDDERPRARAAEDAIRLAYRDDPDRTDVEWRTVVAAAGGDLTWSIQVNLVHTDPAADVSREEVAQIADELRAHPLFAPYTAWDVRVATHLMTRDGNDFHHEVGVWADRARVEWRVDETLDGGSVNWRDDETPTTEPAT
ncbi:hypothetical protein [Cellulomonas sp. NPDC058312]|uniref:hypothetical protein n=1 Tax=Cellulomonas sp. NPDC058312 TaxID=3346441 RepID=UPI0036EAA428